MFCFKILGVAAIVMVFRKASADLCMCKTGNKGNGGKHINEDGVCEFRCSKAFNGIRYCGKGPAYEEGDSIDCQPAKGFAEEQLKKHNSYRAKHRSPPLSLDTSLTKGAETWAKQMASTGHFGHDPNRGGWGENVGMFCGPNPGYDGATDAWYNEEKDYDYKNVSPTESCKKRNCMVGHFTQLVWKASTKLGIAQATRKQENGNICTYVVARYSPPGNVIGVEMYKQNVQKP